MVFSIEQNIFLRRTMKLFIISTKRIYWISKDGSDIKIESWGSSAMSHKSLNKFKYFRYCFRSN